MCATRSKSGPRAGSCTICPIGKISGVASSECADCVANQGFVSSSEGHASCTFWGPGKRADSGTNLCESCEKGTYSSGGGDSCSDCKDGKFRISSTQVSCDECSTCGVGKFIKTECSAAQNAVCDPCTSGKASLGGLTSCLDCNGPGQWSGDSAAICSTVGAEYRANSSHTGAEPCPINSFSTGATDSCTLCGDGFTSAAGAASCTFCGPGQYKLVNALGVTSCGQCSGGTHSETGAGCVSCGPGTYNGEGAAY